MGNDMIAPGAVESVCACGKGDTVGLMFQT